MYVKLQSGPNELMLAIFENDYISEFSMDWKVVATVVSEWSNTEKHSILTWSLLYLPHLAPSNIQSAKQNFITSRGDSQQNQETNV